MIRKGSANKITRKGCLLKEARSSHLWYEQYFNFYEKSNDLLWQEWNNFDSAIKRLYRRVEALERYATKLEEGE